jgi:GGDEF domain-containing protein
MRGWWRNCNCRQRRTLTGAFNGALEVLTGKRRDQRLNPVAADVDVDVQDYNDTYGHVIGDRVLANLAGYQ